MTDTQPDNVWHPPDVEVMEMIATPHNDHLSLALHHLYSAATFGNCSRRHSGVPKLPMSSMIHAWAAMEGAVNLAIFNCLKNEQCPYFIQPQARTVHDKRIAAKFQGDLPFEERITYLAQRKACCSVVSAEIGKIRQFERLRNDLLHGYIIRQQVLLERVDGTTVETRNSDGTVSSATEYREAERVVQASNNTHQGIADVVKEKYGALGLQHDITNFCLHDAVKCTELVLRILTWLDNHFGVCTIAVWTMGATMKRFATRPAAMAGQCYGPTDVATIKQELNRSVAASEALLPHAGC
jgi:acyl-CoA-binding protein